MNTDKIPIIFLEIVFKYFFYIYYKCKKNDLQRQVLLFANLISGEEIHSIYSLFINLLTCSLSHSFTVCNRMGNVCAGTCPVCICQGQGKTLGAWLYHSLPYSRETVSITEPVLTGFS